MKLPISTHKTHLDTLYGTNTLYAALIDGNVSVYSFSAIANSDTFTVTGGHDFVVSTRVQVGVQSGGTLPSGLSASTDYYVVDVTSTTFKLSATKGGSPIVVTNTGNGTLTVAEQALNVDLDDSLENWVRHEVNYYDSGRQTYVAGLAQIGTVNNTLMAYTSPVTITFQPTSGSISARYLVLIRGGNITAGNSTGVLDQVEDFVTAFTIPSNTPKSFQLSQRKYNP